MGSGNLELVPLVRIGLCFGDLKMINDNFLLRIRNRRGEFKRYEMEKRLDREARLKEMKDEDARKAEENEYRQMQEKHKKHEKPHHPMTKDQLEEVGVRVPRVILNVNRGAEVQVDPRGFVPLSFLLSDLGGQGSHEAGRL